MSCYIVVRTSLPCISATLNICIAYASSDEIAYSVNECVQRHKKGHPSGPINTNDLDNNMMLTNTPPVDIMVRTSGVRRLSDFLLWQVGWLVLYE